MLAWNHFKKLYWGVNRDHPVLNMSSSERNTTSFSENDIQDMIDDLAILYVLKCVERP